MFDLVIIMPETSPRQHNKLCEIYITLHRGKYVVTIKNKVVQHYSCHETLIEAKQIRDAILENAISHH
jgi:hypothetical protein